MEDILSYHQRVHCLNLTHENYTNKAIRDVSSITYLFEQLGCGDGDPHLKETSYE